MSSHKVSIVIIADVVLFWLCGFSGLFCTGVSAQNYTVGDSVGWDDEAYLFSPFKFEADRGEEAYCAHVAGDLADTSGQWYACQSFMQTTTPGITPPVWCTVTQFYDLIRNQTNCLGVLLATTHGSTNALAIEPYSKDTIAGQNAALAAYWRYRNSGFSSEELGFGRTSTGYYIVAITDVFIRHYGRLTQGLVYVGACEGYSLTDDFIAADARVAVGNTDHPNASQQKTRVTTFFRRMDGKEGQGKRPVSQARKSPPSDMSNLGALGQENTVLAPTVSRVSAPPLLAVWSGPVFVDTLLIRLGHNLRLELGRTNVPEC